jgi:hypothetical protein
VCERERKRGRQTETEKEGNRDLWRFEVQTHGLFNSRIEHSVIQRIVHRLHLKKNEKKRKKIISGIEHSVIQRIVHRLWLKNKNRKIISSSSEHSVKKRIVRG